MQKLVALLQEAGGQLGEEVRTAWSPQGQPWGGLINPRLIPEFNPHLCIWTTLGVSFNLSESRFPLL